MLKIAVPLFAFVALLVLAACGGDEEETTTPAVAVTPTATATFILTLPPTPAPTATPLPTPTPIPPPTATPKPTPTATPGPLRIITGPTLLTADAAFGDWSPDGSQIAFSASDSEGEVGIHLMNADGSNRISLVSASDVAASALWGAVWSPDGAKIAFVSASERTYGIYVIDKDGSNVQRLTESGATDRESVWSTDGSRIAFTRTTVISTADYTVNSDIYLMNADGSDIVQLTDDPSPDRWPIFLLNGREIAFQSTRDGNDAIYVMNIEGSNLRLLTHVSLEPLPEDYLYVPAF